MTVTDYTLEEWTRSYGETPQPVPTPDIIVKHNAGLFSCFTIRLIFAMVYYNEKKKLPVIDSSKQFEFYKEYPEQDLSKELFSEYSRYSIEPPRHFRATSEEGEIAHSDYSRLWFGEIELFVSLYFNPSEKVKSLKADIERVYNLDYDNMCAVFFRGNDKKRETPEIPYSAFLYKATEILNTNPGIKFLLLPDETEFKEAFLSQFPDNTILMRETLHMRKKDSAIFFELPKPEKPKHAIQFFAEVLIASQCKHVISHTGNASMWCAIYRGNTDNFYQYQNDKFLSA